MATPDEQVFPHATGEAEETELLSEGIDSEQLYVFNGAGKMYRSPLHYSFHIN